MRAIEGARTTLGPKAWKQELESSFSYSKLPQQVVLDELQNLVRHDPWSAHVDPSGAPLHHQNLPVPRKLLLRSGRTVAPEGRQGTKSDEKQEGAGIGRSDDPAIRISPHLSFEPSRLHLYQLLPGDR
eukprot:scaffold135_cov249-Pinguiococcus_pyrenoidosus.AAC.17